MKYVLDTNIVSALMKRDPRVTTRLSALARADVAVPQPVLAEIAYGIERAPASKRKDTLRESFDYVRPILQRAAWTDAVTDAFGRIKARLEKLGQPLEDFDIAVAAHAVAQSAVLVTENVRHMERVSELEIENWLAD